MIEYKRAVEGDWPDLARLRATAEQVMRASGLYTERQLSNGRRHLVGQFERGDMFIARDGANPVGAIGLSESGPDFWGDDPELPEALYVSKVMAAPRSGVAVRLLSFAEFQALDAGRPVLRLDCVARNPRLRALWKERGFEFLRVVDGPGYEAALFERNLR